MAKDKAGFIPLENKIYTLQELADKFHTTRQTMRKWLNGSNIRCIRVGNNYFIHGKHISDYFMVNNIQFYKAREVSHL